eukprot:3768105-Rhodomonas_salina.1
MVWSVSAAAHRAGEPRDARAMLQAHTHTHTHTQTHTQSRSLSFLPCFFRSLFVCWVGGTCGEARRPRAPRATPRSAATHALPPTQSPISAAALRAKRRCLPCCLFASPPRSPPSACGVMCAPMSA